MLKHSPIVNGRKHWFRSPARPTPPRRTARLSLEGLEARQLLSADPVLMVIANQDFWYQDYSEPRQALLDAGYEVKVAAARADVAVPHWGSGQGSDGGFVRPDLALADVNADDYSAIVFVGGWGAASYQYAFEGTYHNAAYNASAEVRDDVNRLVNDFVAQDKYVSALCTGVTVLAWARVDGASPLEGKQVAAYSGWMPDYLDAAGTYHVGDRVRTQIESNGASMFASSQIGDPSTAADDVWVDGKIITAEDYRSGYLLGRVLADRLTADSGDDGDDGTQDPQKVLMVLANRDFFYQEYGEPRQQLEAAGFVVEVAAATLDVCIPHWGSGQGADGGRVQPDLALADVDASDYSAIVFVGGWGASQYQYAYEGTYDNAAYNGSAAVRDTVNRLINDFVDQDRYVAAICHGVSVLAWARVDGVSPLDGRTVAGVARGAPAGTYDGVHYNNFEQSNVWHIEANGGTVLASGSVGDPATTADDVWVDGKIITAENNEGARRLGEVLAGELYRA